MKVRLTHRAVSDLEEISEYLKPRSPAGALRVSDALLKSLDLLSKFPKAGRRQTVPGVRKLIAHKYPYLIYYLVDEGKEQIFVLSIQHPSRERDYRDE